MFEGDRGLGCLVSGSGVQQCVFGSGFKSAFGLRLLRESIRIG